LYGRGDRALGIGLGVVIGIAVVAGFVFLGSEDTVDAPSISGSVTTQAPPPAPKESGVPTVRVVGGAPPDSGPPKLEFKQGERVRFKVISDSAVGAVEVIGLGQSKNVPANKPVTFDFPARKAGLFAVVVAASHIAVATLHVAK
jgi:hypothetical protein